MRVGIIALLQESNTFIPERTQLGQFRNDVLAVGNEVQEVFTGTHHEIGGFLACLREEHIETVPIFAARAVPFGVIAKTAWDELMSMMFRALAQSGPLDGILVAPHGATVSEPEPDADGYWLHRLRSSVGPSVPIIGTLDPHANLSSRMVESTNALIAYRTNPHTDQFETGVKAASLLVRTMIDEVQPKQCAVFPPMAINIERQETAVSPCSELYSLADQQLRDSGVLANSILLGFAYADVAEMGSATLAVADNAPDRAEHLAVELAEYLWQHRAEFCGENISLNEAMQRASQLEGAICLLDTGDNIGGGSPGDSTWLAHALIQRHLGPALMCLVDPLAVAECERAGVGQTILLKMGGHSGPLHGAPLETRVKILDLRDGKFEESEPRHGGFSVFDQGRIAVVQTESKLTLILTSLRVPPFSLKQITSCGLDPVAYRVLVAKGVVAPLAAYRSVCQHFIRVATPGATTTDLTKLNYRWRRKPLYPLENDCDWHSDSSSKAFGMGSK